VAKVTHSSPTLMMFPSKLHQLLEDAARQGNDDAISWLPDGKSFKVHDKVKLEKLMPRYFGSSKHRSFQKNLNMWEFRTVLVVPRSTTSPHRGECSHPLFVRGKPELYKEMKRVIKSKCQKKTVRASTSGGTNTSGIARSLATPTPDATATTRNPHPSTGTSGDGPLVQHIPSCPPHTNTNAASSSFVRDELLSPVSNLVQDAAAKFASMNVFLHQLEHRQRQGRVSGSIMVGDSSVSEKRQHQWFSPHCPAPHPPSSTSTPIGNGSARISLPFSEEENRLLKEIVAVSQQLVGNAASGRDHHTIQLSQPPQHHLQHPHHPAPIAYPQDPMFWINNCWQSYQQEAGEARQQQEPSSWTLMQQHQQQHKVFAGPIFRLLQEQHNDEELQQSRLLRRMLEERLLNKFHISPF
jgi:hypothetical protein